MNAYLNVQLQIEHIIFRLTIQVQDYSVHLQILLHAKILIQHNNYISNMIQIYVLWIVVVINIIFQIQQMKENVVINKHVIQI